MSPVHLRGRLRTALRSLTPSEQGEVLLLSLALGSTPGVFPGFRTPAGAKAALAHLVRATVRDEPVHDVDAEKLPQILERLRS